MDELFSAFLKSKLTVKASDIEEIENEMLQKALEASKAESHGKHPESSMPATSLNGGESSSGTKRRVGDEESQSTQKKPRVHRIALSSEDRNNDDSNDYDNREFDGNVVQPDNMRSTFDDVHVDQDIIDSLRIFMLSGQDPDAFKVGILTRQSSTGILLYGPPGTGKTLLVRVLANQVNARILAISGADIRSKYVGEGEKKIKRMFDYARRHHPCIIFIDEADSVFCSRSSESVSRGHLSDINQFLTEMDGIYSKESNNPMLIAASNRPFDIDEGILRRLGRRVLVDLPDAIGREKILKIHLNGEKIDPSLDLTEIARSTQDFTGSDLRDLVYEAALTAVREIHENKLTTGGSKAKSQGQDSSGATRVLRRDHFIWARRVICPAPKSELLAKIGDFHSRYGSVGGTSRQRSLRAERINKSKSLETAQASSSTYGGNLPN